MWGLFSLIRRLSHRGLRGERRPCDVLAGRFDRAIHGATHRAQAIPGLLQQHITRTPPRRFGWRGTRGCWLATDREAVGLATSAAEPLKLGTGARSTRCQLLWVPGPAPAPSLRASRQERRPAACQARSMSALTYTKPRNPAG